MGNQGDDSWLLWGIREMLLIVRLLWGIREMMLIVGCRGDTDSVDSVARRVT